MKKQVIVILSLVLLVAITLGAYLFVRNNNQEKQKKESEDAAALQLVDFNSSNINKIEIQTPDGDDYTAVIGAESNVWELTEDTDFHINVYFLNSKNNMSWTTPIPLPFPQMMVLVHYIRENSPQRRSTII